MELKIRILIINKNFVRDREWNEYKINIKQYVCRKISWDKLLENDRMVQIYDV